MYLIRFALLCIDMVNDFLTKSCPYVAGAIAFYTLFSLFPLILAIISIWGFFLGPDVNQVELAEDVADVIPISSGFIAETVRGVASARVITGIVSALGLVWASSAAFGAIRKGINIAWGIQKTRPFIKERLIDMALATGAGILMVMLLFVAPTASSIHKGLVLVFPDISFEFLSESHIAGGFAGPFLLDVHGALSLYAEYTSEVQRRMAGRALLLPRLRGRQVGIPSVREYIFGA